MTSFAEMVDEALSDQKTTQENIFNIHCKNISVTNDTSITLEDGLKTITKISELREHFPLVTDDFVKKVIKEYGLSDD